MSEPVKIAVVVKDGIVEVISAGVPVEYVVVDYDTDGCDGVVPVPQNGASEDAILTLADAGIDGPFVLTAFELAGAA
jgi:hypothetical protein